MLPSSLSCFTPSRRPGQAASSLASPGFTWLSLQRHSPCELASVTWQCGLQVVLTSLGQASFASPGFTCSESARAAVSSLQSESRHAALFARLGSGFCLTLSGSSRVLFGFKLTGSCYWQVRVALTLDDERSPSVAHSVALRAIRFNFKGGRVDRRLGQACLAPASVRLGGWNGVCGGATYVWTSESAGPGRHAGGGGTPTGVTPASRGAGLTSEKDPKELAPVASVRILCRRPASGGARGARRNVAGPLCHALGS